MDEDKLRGAYTIYFSRLTIFIAVELLLAFSAVGYVMIAPIAITFMTLPVLLGALLLGPLAGGALGLVFGLTSIWKSGVSAVSYGDIIFCPYVSGEPVPSLILSVGCRVMFGLIAGALFLKARESPRFFNARIVLISVFSLALHSFMVYSTIYLLFPKAGLTVDSLVGKMTSISNIFSWMILGLLVVFCNQAVHSNWTLGIRERIYSIENASTTRRFYYILGLVTVVVSVLSLGMLFHFYSRAAVLLLSAGIILSPDISERIFALGLQFLVASVSLWYLIILLFLLYEKYLSQIEKKSERDVLTNLYNRRAMRYKVEKLLKDGQSGAFFILDLDYFKKVNDTHGHPFGDEVIKEIARILKQQLPPDALIARLGGDEFEAFIFFDENVQADAVLRQLCEAVRTLRFPKVQHDAFSCSIGAVICEDESSYDNLYRKADHALYEVKRGGRNGYMFAR